MILSDFDLRNYIKSGRLVVKPFTESTLRENGIDLRIGDQIARLKRTDKVFDITQFMKNGGYNIGDFFEIEEGEEFLIRPFEHVLISSLEYLELPNDLMGFVELRSTFARIGLVIPPTIIDAGFKGQITLEVRGAPFPVRLRRGMRFAHVIFAKLTSPVLNPYRGKYFGQRGVTLPKLDRED
ncbi:MAG: dCTP deaminase [Thermoprotei archaeon]|nr:MAG: dCTP deaminase [Thermoprotei archaeon]RLF20381.1 MAG: dCTP deaminase [Thermoprotei archaeon]